MHPYANDEVDVVQLLNPAARTTTQTSAALDTSDYVRAYLLITYGAYTDGTFTPSLTSSDTSGGAYTAEAGTNYDVFAAVSTNGSQNSVVKVDLDLRQISKRFIKLVQTAAGTTSGAVHGAVFVGERKKK